MTFKWMSSGNAALGEHISVFKQIKHNLIRKITFYIVSALGNSYFCKLHQNTG